MPQKKSFILSFGSQKRMIQERILRSGRYPVFRTSTPKAIRQKGGRDLSPVATGQGMLEVAKTALLCHLHMECGSANTLISDVWPPNLREYISVVLSHYTLMIISNRQTGKSYPKEYLLSMNWRNSHTFGKAQRK